MSRGFYIILILVSFIVFVSIKYYSDSLAVALGESREVIFIISKGDPVGDIAAKLKRENLINNEIIFKFFVYFKKLDNKFQAGEYKLYSGMGMREIVSILTSGEYAIETKITVIEGWDSKKIADYLSQRRLVAKDDFLFAVNKPKLAWLEKYEFLKDKPFEASLEGYLFPDTYRVFVKTDTNQIIEIMLDNFDKKFNKDLREEVKRQGKTVYDILKMASVIEKEASKEKDREIVSGIFYRRLQLGMALESCATINYILGNSKKRLTIEDTRIKSPYNTYLNPGLPLSPICNPSLSSIKAAIYPEKTDYLFFLSKEDDGAIVYSKTSKEHNINKAKYLK